MQLNIFTNTINIAALSPGLSLSLACAAVKLFAMSSTHILSALFYPS
jgi:hypothetical protein